VPPESSYLLYVWLTETQDVVLIILAATSSAFDTKALQSNLLSFGIITTCFSLLSSLASIFLLEYAFLLHDTTTRPSTFQKDLEELENAKDFWGAMHLCGFPLLLRPCLYYSWTITALAGVSIIGGYTFGILTPAIDTSIIIGIIVISLLSPYAMILLAKAIAYVVVSLCVRGGRRINL